MTRIVTLSEINSVMPKIDVLAAMAQAFMDYSLGRAVVPPVGELIFNDPPGDVHIKYGYLKEDAVFVIKIASGFYDNPKKGLPANSGLNLVFSQFTGLPVAILLDEGFLTNIRTAAAGALAAKTLANPDVRKIAVFGNGVQARLQLQMLSNVTTCRDVVLWSRRKEAAKAAAREMEKLGFAVTIDVDLAHAARDADLIVTATATETPLITAADLKPGVHITAMGSDTPNKQELHSSVLERADVVVADSISQCRERGEIHHALAAGRFSVDRVVELGDVLARRKPGRSKVSDITVADLTGVAVQDVAISKAVLEAMGVI